jgi:hypothetical protein
MKKLHMRLSVTPILLSFTNIRGIKRHCYTHTAQISLLPLMHAPALTRQQIITVPIFISPPKHSVGHGLKNQMTPMIMETFKEEECSQTNDNGTTKLIKSTTDKVNTHK